MTQNTEVELLDLVYDRADYTALRAYCLKISLQRIADLYYSEDSPQLEQGLERWLIDMCSHLVERAIEHNPAAAEALQHARQGGAVTATSLDILIRAADLPKPIPDRAAAHFPMVSAPDGTVSIPFCVRYTGLRFSLGRIPCRECWWGCSNTARIRLSAFTRRTARSRS